MGGDLYSSMMQGRRGVPGQRTWGLGKKEPELVYSWPEGSQRKAAYLCEPGSLNPSPGWRGEVGGEDQLHTVVLWLPNMCSGTCALLPRSCTHMLLLMAKYSPGLFTQDGDASQGPMHSG